MIKDLLIVKDLTKFLSAKLFCFIGLVFIASLFVCSAPKIIQAEESSAGKQPVSADIKSGNEQTKLKKHILVITAQPYHTDWFDTLNRSLRNNLFSFLSSDSKFSYEYIGSESLANQQYNVRLIDMFQAKYAHIKLDMVIAIMPVSCQFILDHGETVFPGIAAIFVLPSSKQYPRILERPRSGVVKSASNAIPDTIERIRIILPETKHLVVASGSGADDLNYQRIAEETLSHKRWPETVEYLKGLPAEELAVRLGKLPEHSAVLLLTYLQDQHGNPVTTVQVIKYVSERTSIPIFSFYDTLLGLGIVGGKLTSTEAYGDAIADTAMKIFQGRQTLPVVETVAESRDIYDWRQMEKWKISQDRLPVKSEIRYRKVSFWAEHWETVTLIAAVILIETFLILALLFNLARRKRAETALSLSEKKYHDIFDNAIMGIYQSTPEGKYLNVNPALAELFGYATPDEMLANVQDIEREIYVHPEERIKIKDIFASRGRVKGFQAEYKRRDGSRFWISITGKTICDEAGKILYYEGTVEDITKQKQAENELIKYRDHLEALVRERTEKLEETNKKLSLEIEERTKTEKALAKSETMYRDLVESANSVILRWTAAGEITFINKFAQQFFEFSAEEILGKNIMGTIVPEVETSGRVLSSMVSDVVRNPAAYEGHVNENIRKNGERVWVAWTNKPLVDESGRMVEILSIGTDITKLVEAQSKLRETIGELDRAKERAESADRLKSAFLATMSHELRTPLNSIIGFTGILLQRLGGPLNEEQDKQLKMVYNSAKHLLELINDVLDISKIEANQLNVFMEPFDLSESIDKVIKSSQPLADKKGIELAESVDPEIRLITSDRRRVEQILLNLISNAVKFTEQGFVRLHGEKRGDCIVLSVQDSGIGIKEEDKGLLFTAFQQIESGITRKYDGTGLGLSICKKLAHLLGGEIEVASEWGKGSTFSFILPG